MCFNLYRLSYSLGVDSNLNDHGESQTKKLRELLHMSDIAEGAVTMTIHGTDE